jgi:predicted amidohydrolase
MLAEAARQEVAIACFPEAFLPGLRGLDFAVPPVDQARQEQLLGEVCIMAARHRVAVIMGMEWQGNGGTLNVAMVIQRNGDVDGYQTKNQIAPSEDPYYVDGVPFGITICHEGWRYPESVRWAARNGARVVFHPHMTGSDLEGTMLTEWGDPQAPYYEKAMLARAAENEIYFASVNCAMRFQESATSLIAPEARCEAFQPYGREGLLVSDLDLDRATGLYAQRVNDAIKGR